MIAETARQRFLRNHQEHRGVMLAAACREEKRGDANMAALIRKMVAVFDDAAEITVRQEGNQ